MLVLCEEKSLVLCRTRTGRSRGSQGKTGHLAGAWSGPALARRATSEASGGDSLVSDTSGILKRNGSCSRHEYRAHPRFISQAMRPTPVVRPRVMQRRLRRPLVVDRIRGALFSRPHRLGSAPSRATFPLLTMTRNHRPVRNLG